MEKIDGATKEVIVAAAAAADRMRADIAAIEKAAILILANPELRAACGFNEGTDLDERLAVLSSNVYIKHSFDAPLHWAMRAGVKP